jgi:hypothetical protein
MRPLAVIREVFDRNRCAGAVSDGAGFAGQ